jgi:hypothetical protein
MTVSPQEEAAIVQFLENMRQARVNRRRLFESASEEPEKVLVYLDSLPEGVESKDDLLQKLREIAQSAAQGQITLIS